MAFLCGPSRRVRLLRADYNRLLAAHAALERIRSLHQPETHGTMAALWRAGPDVTECRHCMVPWPCLTAQCLRSEGVAP